MHYQYWPLGVTVPASTPASSPVQQPYNVVQGHLKQIEIQVPAGHRGQTGMRLLYHGQEIYPWANLAWLVDDNRLRIAEWEDEIMAVGLSVQAYNTDRVPHTFYLLAEIWPTVEPAVADVADQLTEAPSERRHHAAVRQLHHRRQLVPPGG